MKPQTRNARAAAAEIIARWLEDGQPPDRAMGPETPDRAFVMEVVFGVARWKRALLWMLHRLSDRPPDKSLHPLLLTGLYQMLFMDNVADYAAVNETVEAAKRQFPKAVAGFVNGVLRRAQREKGALLEALGRQSPALRLSHPDLLVDRWTRQFGAEKMARLCEWNNGRPHVTIRVDTGRVSAAEYRERLVHAGVEGCPHPFAPDEFISLPPGARVMDLPGFADGLFSVQDPSTRESVRLLDLQPGQRVLDACAAPGGKTMAMATRMAGQGEILALDLHGDRLETVRENLNRMKLAGLVRALEADATRRESVVGVCGDQPFDRVLLDVPCTNTGVIRRRPDARWRFSMVRLKKINGVQRRILDAMAPLVKPGGRLVYSTCSLEPEEGEGMLAQWLGTHREFEMVDSARLFPPDSGTDGIYAAACRRRD